MKFPYNDDYFPSAPSAEIRLGLPQRSLSVGPLRALVDTGADACIVPRRYVRSLRPKVHDRKFLRSQWGERRPVDTYWLDVGIGDMRLPLIEIVADELADEVIVGRNFLNKLIMTLDGPKQELDIPDQ